MKNPNGYGSITKLSGKRRRPYIVRVTAGWSFDGMTQKYKQIQKPLGYYATQAEAIKALADYNDHPFDINKASITFAQVYDIAQADFTNGRRRNYEAAYKYLAPLYDTPIRIITTMHMQRCIDACTTTQQQEIKTVCHKIFDCAMRLEVTDRDPSRFLKSTKLEPVIDRVLFSPDEIRSISDQDQWWGKILMMLLYTGMRTKELTDLTPADIDLVDNVVNISICKNRSSVRQIPIHAHVLGPFSDYKDAGCNLYGCTHNGLNKALKMNFQTLHHAHDCRHTFTSQMRLCGCDPLVLQRLLGHAPQTITERVYTHLSLDELRKNITLLDYGL